MESEVLEIPVSNFSDVIKDSFTDIKRVVVFICFLMSSNLLNNKTCL